MTFLQSTLNTVTFWGFAGVMADLDVVQHYLPWALQTRQSTCSAHIPLNPFLVLAMQRKGTGGREDCVSTAVFASARLVTGAENGVHAYFEVAQTTLYMLRTLEGLKFWPELVHAILPSADTEQIPAVTLQPHYSHIHLQTAASQTLAH